MLKSEHSLKYTPQLINFISISTIVVLIVALFSNLDANESNMNFFFSSDTLYLPSIYQDLFINQADMSGWHLNPAPNFFPDMFFYFILMFITNNFVVTFFLFSIIQYVFLGFLFVKIFKLIFPGSSFYYKLFIYTLLAIFLLEPFFFTKEFLYVFYLIINAYHAGAFIMALLCVFFVFKYITDHKWIWLLLLFVAGFLILVSDRLFIVLYIVPVCLTCIGMYKRIGIKTMLLIVGINIIITVTGLFVFKKIDTDTYNMIAHVGQPAKLNIILEQFALFANQMGGYLASFGIRALTLYGFIISLFLMAYVFFSSYKRSQNALIPFYALFSILFSGCVICAPIITGQYQDQGCLRYNIYPFYLSVLNFSIFIAYWFNGKEISQKKRLVLTGLNLAILFIGFTQLQPAGLKAYFNYYPENAKMVDELAEKENLKCGVANYWFAKKITMFSKKGVKVYAVFNDISFYPHVANDSWFFDNMFNFVILTGFDDTTLYKNKLKDIRYLSNTPQLKLIKARPFYYARFSGSNVINTEIKE